MAEEPGKIKNPVLRKYLPGGCLNKIAIVFVTIVVVLLLQSVPAWLSGKFLPALAESAGVAGLDATVESLGLTRAELRNVRIRIEGRRSVSANTIRVHYQLPLYPFRKHLRIWRLEVIGLRINVIGQDGRWTVPGIYPDLFEKRVPAEPGAVEESGRNGKPSSIDLQQLILSDCEIRIEQDGRMLSIPFAARVNMPPEAGSTWRARADIQFSGDRLEARGNWDRATGELQVKLESELKYLNYTRIFPKLQGKLFGGVAFQGEITGIMNEGEPPAELNGTLLFSKLTAGTRAVMFGVPEGKTFTLAFRQQDPSGFAWECSGLEVLRPFKAELAKSAGLATVSRETYSVNGTLETLLRQQPGINRDVPLKHEFEFNWHPAGATGDWEYRTALTESGWDDRYHSQFEKLEAHCTGSIRGGEVRSQIRLAAAPALALQVSGRPLTAVEPVVTGEIIYSGGLSGHAGLAVKKIEAPKLGAETGPLRITLPLKEGEPGRLNLRSVKVREYELNELDYTILRNGSSLEINGEIRQDILSALRCTNRIGVAWAPALNVEAELKISNDGKEKDMALGNVLPALKDMTMDGKITAEGRYYWNARRHGGEFHMALREGALKSEALRMAASGLEFSVDFPALPGLKTAPLQNLSCRELKFRGFKFENINAEFLLDDQRTFVLENLGLNWCGGSVFTYALRFVPGGGNVNGTIYFDRLNISQIIAEAGLTAAEGDGTIYGRMPLTVGRDGIVLRPGFFYSVPGETRNIRFADLKNMLAALPPGTPQYHQLDLATEALKDFNYDWIKVDFRNEGDKLLIVSRFNGRPVNMLPFAYDEQVGGMVRREGMKANFQGIRLELNSSLPLNQLLKFNTQLKKLFGGNK